MTSADIEKIKVGVKVVINDGSVGEVKGCYLSIDGFVLRVKQGQSGVDRNVPIKNIAEIVTEQETD